MPDWGEADAWVGPELEVRTCRNPHCRKVAEAVTVEKGEDTCPYCGVRFDHEESGGEPFASS